ncbi:hypothetical protein BDR04DRAFT_1150738 [Suillus decipiens]|nr:hypothetical protein BDR04DRAFT_1150738 [Suillus decipiens]
MPSQGTLSQGTSFQDVPFHSFNSNLSHHGYSYGTLSFEMPSQGPSFEMHPQGPLKAPPLRHPLKAPPMRHPLKAPPFRHPLKKPYPTTRPQGVSEQPVSKGLILSTSQPLIKLSKDVIDDTVKAMMKLIMHELFSDNMMTIGKASKKVMLTKVIQDAVLRCFRPNVVFEDFILNKHRMHVANALLVTCRKFIEFVHDGVFNAY